MHLLDLWYNRHTAPPIEKAIQVAFTLLDDILGRKGFDDGWDNTDRETREELLQTLVTKAKKIIES